MIVFLIVLMGILTPFFFAAGKSLASSAATTPIASPTADLSRVSKEIYKEYMALPQDSRPVPDIVSILKALDAQTRPWANEREKYHFNQQWLPYSEVSHGFEFRWIARGSKECQHHMCKFAEYYRLHKNIKQVADALAEKEQAMLESSLAGDLDMLAELQSRLRDEASIQKSITKEFKAL